MIVYRKDGRLEILFKRLYVDSNDPQSQLTISRLYSKGCVSIQVSQLAGSCSSDNSELPPYFWTVLMPPKFLGNALQHTHFGIRLEVEGLHSKWEQAWRRKDGAGSFLLPFVSDLLPAATWLTHLFLYAVLLTTGSCHRNATMASSLNMVLMQLKVSSIIANKGKILPLLSNTGYIVFATIFRKCQTITWKWMSSFILGFMAFTKHVLLFPGPALMVETGPQSQNSSCRIRCCWYTSTPIATANWQEWADGENHLPFTP